MVFSSDATPLLGNEARRASTLLTPRGKAVALCGVVAMAVTSSYQLTGINSVLKVEAPEADKFLFDSFVAPEEASVVATNATANVSVEAGNLIAAIGAPPPPGWSDWISRDTPYAEGDSEQRSEFDAESLTPCEGPTSIECQTTEGVSWEVAAQVFEVGCTLEGGIKCNNADQPEGSQCADYRVRFQCPPMGSAIDDVLGGAENGTGAVTGAVGDAADDMANNTGAVAGAAADATADAAGFLANGTMGIVGGLANATGDAFGAIGNASAAAAGAVADAAGSVANATADAAGAMANATADAAGAVANGTADAAGSVADTVDNTTDVGLAVSAKQAATNSTAAAPGVQTNYMSADILHFKTKITEITTQYQQTAAGPEKDELGSRLMTLKGKLGPMMVAARQAMKDEHDSHRTHLDQLPAANVSAAAPSLSVSEKQTSYVNADITALRAKIAETTAMYQGALAGPAKDGLADTLMGLKNQVAPTLAAARVSMKAEHDSPAARQAAFTAKHSVEAAAPALSMSEKQAVEGDATFAASTSSYVHSGDGVSKIRAKIQSLTATYQQTAAGPDKDVMADQLMHLKNKMGPLLQQAKAAMKSEHDSHRTHMEGVVDPAAAAPVEAAAAPARL